MASSMPLSTSIKKKRVKNGAITPIEPVRLEIMLRAIGLGLYSSWAMAANTFSRVWGFTFALLLSTRETVPIPTPATRATSWIVFAMLLHFHKKTTMESFSKKRFQLLASTISLFEHNILILPLLASVFMLLLNHLMETFPILFSLIQLIHTGALVMVAKSHHTMLSWKPDYGKSAP